jgi:two-component system response regulator YesN
LSKTLSLSELAALLGSSRSSLARTFAQYLNETPINYFIRLKMDAAKSLLQNTNMQIQEIADYVGYNNSLYFSSEFKKRVGKSPREYRKYTRTF